MISVNTSRFGGLEISEKEIITFPEGLVGFADFKKWVIIDPGDDTLILWLQSMDNEDIAFPILEPRIFMDEYIVKLSAQEIRFLGLESVNMASIFSILTIPEHIDEMTANLKAPIVINLAHQVARQVVLQEAHYSVKYAMYEKLRQHLMTIESTASEDDSEMKYVPVAVSDMTPSKAVQAL